ncbi:TonB-dependent receptor [Pseudoalteromonas sp. SG43-7]|uniref:TonB-dependent receptor n=1 Tax=unclassified Pseudoalteromonas TaxID=194690 RepID=UPI001602765E|nr:MULTISPECIES: TonB-dependent receptor [unclassified Pseudoalteromonas]MBB1333470.1 TonB-dependent receptor [Pseudoalteromonas sp. SR41-6]MBB1421034.1 TonB-dependent receptor [Pseudoalteromonas sp. SG43-7]MBB1459206.1 TonB-dependent receptor [Pseudoalteromonas sp. SG41-8]
MKIKYSPLVLAVLTAISTHAMAAEKQIQKDESDLEKIVITASPLKRTVLESSTPVSILSGEELDQHQAATLGETLKNVPGVHSSYFGPVASSPIIRGLDGPRIKVVQNGLGASDASRVGPDHQVSTETSTATQIEVLRGPATLLYGSGAIGGVVNVVDNRLPIERQQGITGEVFAQYDNVADSKTTSTDLNAGTGDFAVHIDAYNRNTGDYKIPAPADINEHGGSTKLSNSAIDAHGYNLGAGWITDDTRVAFAYGSMDSEYGLPGEDGVFIKLKQDRYQGVVDWNNLDGFIKSVHWQNAYTDYQHSEIEGTEIGTTFKNESIESRLWAEHSAVYGWHGIMGLHYNKSDFEAIGEEAFTPPTKTDSLAAFLMEEKQTGALLWQLGTRVEQLTHKVNNQFFDELSNDNSISFADEDYTAVSGSAGVVWSINDKHSLAFNYAYSQRAPSASEIYAYGPHIGSGTYEVGGAFDVVNNSDGTYSVAQVAQSMDKEVSNNLDATYRYNADSWNASISIFQNQIDDYIYEDFSNLVLSDGEFITSQAYDQLQDTGAASDEETDGLPVVNFAQGDAKLYGFEAQVDWHLNEQWRLDVFSDYTRAKLDKGGNVPRIPPLRVGSSIHYEYGNWHTEVEVTRNSKQDKIAANETTTDGYTMLSAAANYYLDLGNVDMTLYLKADNLTDQEARVHSSYLKDEAPLPGRSFSIGVRARF